MDLLVLSDSHGRTDAVAEAIRRTRPDGILYAGDGLRDLSHIDLPCPLWAVRGNCDLLLTPCIIGGRAWEPVDEELITLDGIRILLMHGHRYGVKGSLGSAIARAALLAADVLIFGHTHTPLERHFSPDRATGFPLDKPLTVFNPGSIGGYEGTFGTLTIRGGQFLCGHGKL